MHAYRPDPRQTLPVPGQNSTMPIRTMRFEIRELTAAEEPELGSIMAEVYGSLVCYPALDFMQAELEVFGFRLDLKAVS